MKVIAAYLLAVLGGNASPDAAAINKILDSVGAEADAEAVASLLKEVEGKDVWELIAAGKSKLSSVPSGGAAPTGGVAPTGGAKKEEKEEKKEEKEESEAEMGFDLFGGGGAAGGDAAAADY